MRKLGEKWGAALVLCMRSSLVDSSTEIFRGQHEPCCFITVFLPRHLWEAGVFTSFFSPSNKKGHFNLNKGTKKWQHLSGNYMSWDFLSPKNLHFPKSPTSGITYVSNCFLLPELESHPSYLREDVFKWWFHSKHTFLIASHLPIMEMLVVIYSFP